MTLWALIAWQAVSGPVLPRTPRPPSDAPCKADQTAGDIIVCGRRGPSPYRLSPLPDRYRAAREGLPKAEFTGPGGVKVAAEGEQASDGVGGVVNRAMVRLKVPLGRSRD